VLDTDPPAHSPIPSTVYVTDGKHFMTSTIDRTVGNHEENTSC